MTQDPVELAIQSAIEHHQAGRLDEAIAAYQRAIELRPGHPEALNNLAVAYRQKGLPDRCVEICHRALAASGGSFQLHINLGLALTDLERIEQAIEQFQKAIALNPAVATVHAGLAMALKRQNRLDEAIAAYERALSLNPQFVEALANLGELYVMTGKLERAIIPYQRALQLRPDLVAARINLGGALQQTGEFDLAIQTLRTAIEFDPHSVLAHNNLGMCFKEIGELDAAIASFKRVMELDPAFTIAHDNLLTTLHYHPDYDARSLLAAARQWNRAFAAPLKHHIRPHDNGRDPERPLRIGYVSADFHHHASAFFLLPLFRAHDRSQFDITCYSQDGRQDSITREMQNHVSAWRSTIGVSDEHVAAQIRADRIDILVDLKLYTAKNRLLVFAHKPAPVQVTWLGYPGTTGLDAIDYRLTDPFLDPPGSDESVYTETTVRLPDTFWCYDPLSSEPAVAPLPAAANGFVTFGCLNNFNKVNLNVIKLWARILTRIRDAKFILLVPEGNSRSRIHAPFATAGIDPARLEFIARKSRWEYLNTYQRIDIALDTFPYNGHTTSLDALWMGVPVITLAGSTAVGRGGVSQLSNLGLADLIAREPEHYVQLATTLAADRARLQGLRSSLRQRMKGSPLMDAPRFARGIESAFRSMWRKWCAR